MEKLHKLGKTSAFKQLPFWVWLVLLQPGGSHLAVAQTIWQSSIDRSGDYHIRVSQTHNQGSDTNGTFQFQNDQSFGDSSAGRTYRKYSDTQSYPYAGGSLTCLHDTTFIVTSSNLLASGTMSMKEAISSGGMADENGVWIYSGSAAASASSTFECLVGVGEPTPYTLTVMCSPGAENPNFEGHSAFVTFNNDTATNAIQFGTFNEHGSMHTIDYGQNSGTMTGTLDPFHNYYLHAYIENDGIAVSPTLEDIHQTYGCSRSVKFTLQVGPPTQLPSFGPLTYTTVTPARSNYPWQFSVVNTNSVLVPDTAITLQTTTAPGNPASWESLAEMSSGSGNVWTAQLNQVPAGNRYFRAVLSAPGCADGATPVVGPVNVQQGLPPIDQLSILPWAVNSGSGIYPLGTWTFVLHQLTFTTAGLHVHVQWTANPGDTNSWANLSGGGELTSFSQFSSNPSGTWELDTTNVPVAATVYFRAVADAPGYLSSYSSAQGPYNITPPLPLQTDHIASDTSVALSAYPGANSGHELHLLATNCATVQLSVSGNTTVSSTLGLQGGGCATASLKIASGAQLTSSRTTIARGATLENQGIINGPVTLIGQDGNGLIGQDGNGLIGQDGNGLIGQDGNGIVAQGGGNLTFNKSTAAIVAQGGGNIVAQGGGNIVAQGGGNIVAQGGGNIMAKSGGNLRKLPAGGGRGTTSQQPGFIGQMVVNGNYNQFAGTLIIGIAGTNTLADGAQEYDQLVVHGTANLVGGTIAFGLFNPADQADQSAIFLPPEGATFDVVVATNILVDTVRLRGLLWGDGLFFTGNVVARNDGLQALRLTATRVPPKLYLFKNGAASQLAYATNYVGYAVESSDSLQSETLWKTYSFGTNVVNFTSTNACQFFRLNR